MTNELSHKLLYQDGFRIYKTSDDYQEFVTSVGTLICLIPSDIQYLYFNMQLNMLQSSTYAINKIDNTIDDGSLWIKKMNEFNNSRAFDFI